MGEAISSHSAVQDSRTQQCGSRTIACTVNSAFRPWSGFGFISREGEAKDLFFHSKELNGVTFDELKVGDTVQFEVSQGEKGPAATNVSRA